MFFFCLQVSFPILSYSADVRDKSAFILNTESQRKSPLGQCRAGQPQGPSDSGHLQEQKTPKRQHLYVTSFLNMYNGKADAEAL